MSQCGYRRLIVSLRPLTFLFLAPFQTCLASLFYQNQAYSYENKIKHQQLGALPVSCTDISLKN